MYPRFDPVASLRIRTVEATLGAGLVRIPALSAADWLPVLMGRSLRKVIDLLEDFDLIEGLLEEQFTVVELEECLAALVEAAAGRSAKAAFAIVGGAGERWDLIGADLARAGVRFTEISLGAALDAIYGSLIRHMDEKRVVEFNRLLMVDSGGGGLSHPRRGPGGVRRQRASATQSGGLLPKTQLLPRSDPPGGPSVQPSVLLQPPAGSDHPEGMPSVLAASESPPGV